MQKVILILMFTVFAFASYAKGLDTTNLNFGKKQKQKDKEKDKGKPAAVNEDYLFLETAEGEDFSVLKKKIDAMKLILVNRPLSEDKIALHTRHATLNLKLADILKGVEKEKSLYRRSVRFANRSARFVVESKRASEKERAVGYYLYGMALAFGDKPLDAIQNFQKSLKMEPESSQALPMYIFIGEYYFGSQKFKTAKFFYNKALELKRKKHKNFIRYKLAWSHMNSKEYLAAEKLFLEIVGPNMESEELFAESMTDLAFLESFRKGESEIIQFAKENFGKDPDKQRMFVTKISRFLADQGNFGSMNELIAKVLKYQKSPVERIKIYMMVMENRSQEFATSSHLNVFKAIVAEIKKGGLTLKDPDYEAIQPEIISATESLIKSFSQTYNGQVESREKGMTKTVVAKELGYILEKYLELFDNSPNKKVVVGIKISLCTDLGDYLCVEKLSKKVLADKDMESIHDEVVISRIEALGELSRKNRKKYYREYLSLMTTYAERKERNETWAKITRRLGAVYQSENQHEKAEIWLRNLHEYENSSDTLYMLNVSLYKLGKFGEVLNKTNISPPKKGSKKLSASEKNLLNLNREAILQLAIKAKREGNISDYESSMRKFLAMAPEGDKAAIAVKDYLLTLFNAEKYSKVTEVLKMVPPEERGNERYRDILITVIYKYFSLGRLNDAYTIMTGVPSNVPDILYLQILSKLGHKRKLDNYEISKVASLKKEHRDHVLELMTLGLPDEMLKYFWKARDKSDQVKRFALLAIKLQQGVREINLNSQQRLALESVLPSSLKPYPRTNTEKILLGIRFPASFSDEQKVSQLVQKAASELSKSREIIARDLESVPLRVRPRILETAIRNERKMAQTLERSPPPSNLSPVQQKAYKKQIKQLAKQYYDQARQYEVANGKVKGLMSRLKDNKGFVTLIEMEEWPWPQGQVSAMIRDLVKRRLTIGALIVADFNLGQGKISKGDLYNFRGGILLSRWPHWQGVNYVKLELKSSGQNHLVKYIEENS